MPRITWETAIGLSLQLVDALHALYGTEDPAGEPLCAVHGDLSPENLIVQKDGTLRLVDLGVCVSRLMPGRWWQFNGKTQWAAPERVEGLPPSVQSDLYSVGALIFHTLTGMRPIDATPQLLSINRPEAPPALAELIGELTHKSASNRHGSFRAVAEDLSALLGGADPASRCRSGLPRQWTRRQSGLPKPRRRPAEGRRLAHRPGRASRPGDGSVPEAEVDAHERLEGADELVHVDAAQAVATAAQPIPAASPLGEEGRGDPRLTDRRDEAVGVSGWTSAGCTRPTFTARARTGPLKSKCRSSRSQLESRSAR